MMLKGGKKGSRPLQYGRSKTGECGARQENRLNATVGRY
uniref:Uncharacterized protein n=1 Tax=Candidatus Kentrum sp. DK TaxID=2126562 RepID=A0A450T6Q6_9GAMM|nr:MAG: hypothetical protein BECKDK2373B_GA0170837_11107 [Candidatus Kentron sp. DK]